MRGGLPFLDNFNLKKKNWDHIKIYIHGIMKHFKVYK